jgi:hypothetical protein
MKKIAIDGFPYSTTAPGVSFVTCPRVCLSSSLTVFCILPPIYFPQIVIPKAIWQTLPTPVITVRADFPVASSYDTTMVIATLASRATMVGRMSRSLMEGRERQSVGLND